MKRKRFFGLLAMVAAVAAVLGIEVARGSHPEIRVVGTPLPDEPTQVWRLVRGLQWSQTKWAARALRSPKTWFESYPHEWSARDVAWEGIRGMFGSIRKITIQPAPPMPDQWFTRSASVEVTDPFDKKRQWQYDLIFVTNGWRIETYCHGFR